MGASTRLCSSLTRSRFSLSDSLSPVVVDAHFASITIGGSGYANLENEGSVPQPPEGRTLSGVYIENWGNVTPIGTTFSVGRRFLIAAPGTTITGLFLKYVFV